VIYAFACVRTVITESRFRSSNDLSVSQLPPSAGLGQVNSHPSSRGPDHQLHASLDLRVSIKACITHLTSFAVLDSSRSSSGIELVHPTIATADGGNGEAAEDGVKHLG